MEKGQIDSLSHQALRCAMMGLGESLFKLQKVFTEKYGIEETLDSLYFDNSEETLANDYETIQNIVSGKEIQELVDYHKPYREILTRTDLLSIFHGFMRDNVIVYHNKNSNGNYNYCDQYFESEDSLLTFIFWLCFENFESESLFLHQVREQLKEDPTPTRETYKSMFDLVFEYILNSSNNMDKCTTLEICIEKLSPYGDHSFPSLLDLDRFFKKFPNLQTLDFDARHSKDLDDSFEKEFLYNKKDLFSIISKIELSTLKIHFDEDEAEDFCHYIATAPKTLKHLVFRFELKERLGILDTKKALSGLIMIMKALKEQKNLRFIYFNIVFDVDVNSVEEDIEDPIDYVTKIIIESTSTGVMKLIDRYFINVKTFSMIIRGISC